MERYNRTLHFDSERENLFFTSDLHFNHFNVIRYNDRPYTTKEEMNEDLINKWNAVVGEKDYVFVLGDFSFGSNATWKHLTERLKGRKYLILGNHDTSFAGKWEKVDNIMNLHVKDPEVPGGQRITLCHYPMLSWYKSRRGAWQLYGHLHGTLYNTNLAEREGFDIRFCVRPQQVDVGVDVFNYAPVSYHQLKEVIKQRKIVE